uniref:hypothetical protein n=1 Tax=Serratia proteamaculans TaxID=28151 RepID=UPI001F4C06CB|nr:hypothetical protein [Serratia proteamaculans]ULG13380.1 hypothetical protein AGR96Xp_00011 [Serratia proteamaculans]ULG17208.1 hypothetical protein 20093p_00106 [Serratia proteamaculans]ULG18096.1 hypothetical protein LCp1_00106 [Serratia proteamaculans]ULG19579.1 hypothetical protein Sprot5p_00089 [Serratia proteamaculans]
MKPDNYSIIREQEDNVAALRCGNGIVRVESWMPDDYIGKMLRKKLEQADGAAVTVTYEVITEEMQQAAQRF